MLGIAVIFGIFGYALFKGGSSGSSGIAVNEVGQSGTVTHRQVQDFRITTINGDSFDLAAHRGKVVVVNFWSSWCPPCRAEAPALERVWRSIDPNQVAFIGIATWDTEKAVLSFAQEVGMTFPNARDLTGEVVVDFGVTGIPETFILGADGRVVKRWIGPIDDIKLRQLIQEALDAAS